MEGFVVVLIVGGVIALAIHTKNQQKKRIQAAMAQAGAHESFPVGRHVTGLEQAPAGAVTYCGVTEADLVFVGVRGTEQGRIPRDSVNSVLVDRTTQITQRLTATRMLTLGIFSLAAPKKKKNEEFSALVDWDDANGIRQNTVFQTTTQGAGNAIANRIRAALRPKAARLGHDERKCPYCREIIKRDAAICRYCRQPLAAVEAPMEALLSAPSENEL